jgi:hypothetical protein
MDAPSRATGPDGFARSARGNDREPRYSAPLLLGCFRPRRKWSSFGDERLGRTLVSAGEYELVSVMAELMLLFKEALFEFLRRERDNIRADISERNLCGRLMLYLDAARERFGLWEYFTDTEYNRNLGDLKRIRHNPEDAPDIITCDLILHSRGRLPADNLIAIEMKKKKHSRASKDADRKRLEALTRSHAAAHRLSGKQDHVYGYQLGLFIELDTKRTAYLIEVYQEGAKVDEQRGSF